MSIRSKKRKRWKQELRVQFQQQVRDLSDRAADIRRTAEHQHADLPREARENLIHQAVSGLTVHSLEYLAYRQRAAARKAR